MQRQVKRLVISVGPTLLVHFLSGCVTSPEKATGERRLVERSPGADQKPQWVAGPEKVHDKQEHVYKYKVMISMDDNARGDACTEAAEMGGQGRVLDVIAMDVMKQAGYSTDESKNSMSSVVTKLSHENLSGIERIDSYWERVEITDNEIGTKRLDCWAQIEVPEQIINDAKSAVKGLHKKIDDQMKEHKDAMKHKDDSGDNSNVDAH